MKKSTIAAIILAFCAFTSAFAGSRAYNLSTRGFVGTGDNVLIGGVIVGEPPEGGPCEDGGPDGNGPINFVIRALGPSLTNNNLPGAELLQDPTLEFYDGNGQLVGVQHSFTEETTAQLTKLVELGLAPTDLRECAMFLQLLPGEYTAIVRGANDATGIALMEVYKLPAQ